MFWQIKSKNNDPHDAEILRLVEAEWDDFSNEVREKVGHLEDGYITWRKRSLITKVTLVVGIVVISTNENGSILELVLGNLFGFSSDAMLALSLFLGIVLFGVSGWVLWRWSKVNHAFNKIFNPIVFDKAFSVLGFAGHHVTKESVSQQEIIALLDHSELITERRNRYEIDDMVISEYEGRSLFVAELNVKHVSGSGKNRRIRKVFHGILITHDLPKTLTGKTFITTEGDKRGFGEVSWWRRWFKKQEAPKETILEWNDFENKLHVATTDMTEARYILTPDFMSTLYDWWVIRKGKIRVSFIDNRMYVLYPDKNVKIGVSTVSLEEADLKQYVLQVARPLWHVKQLMKSAEVRLRDW